METSKGYEFGFLDHIFFQLTIHKNNNMIKHDHHACLADFSLATLAQDHATFVFTCVGG